MSGSFSGSCQDARPCIIFSALVTLVLVSHPAKLRQDTSQTLDLLSNTERDNFSSGSCLADVWLRERYSRQSQAGFRLCLVQKFRTGPTTPTTLTTSTTPTTLTTHDYTDYNDYNFNKLHYIQQIHSLFQLHKIVIDYEMYIRDSSYGCITNIRVSSGICPLIPIFLCSLKELCHGIFIHFSDLTKLFSH